MTSEWMPVKGLEGLYEVNRDGVVRRKETQKVLKAFPNHKGYLNVVMHKNSKPISRTIHRIVAEAFIPNELNYPQVNHIDANKLNNNVNNLEWVTNLQNMKHAIEHGCFKNHSIKQRLAALENVKKAQMSQRRPVVWLDIFGNYIKTFNSIVDAEKETGCHNSKITSCCRGRRNTTHGYKFMYLEEYK